MAARRLLIVMVVLLGLSTLSWALVPPPEENSDRPEKAAPPEGDAGKGSEAAAAPAEPEPRVISARMEVGNEAPKVVVVRPGDELRLEVSGSVGEDIEIPAFGLTDTMTPDAPARFSLIVDRAGEFEVRAAESGIVAGRIRAGMAPPEPASSSPAPAGAGSVSENAPLDGREPRADGRSGQRPSAAADRQRP